MTDPQTTPEDIEQENASLRFKLKQRTIQHENAIKFISENKMTGDFMDWIMRRKP